MTQWHKNFEHALLSRGYTSIKVEKCVYTKYGNDGCIVICLYIDDMLIFGTNTEIAEATKKLLLSNFDMSDPGETNVTVGVKITRTEEGYMLSLEHYAERTPKKFGHFDCSPLSTLYDVNLHLERHKGDVISQPTYV